MTNREVDDSSPEFRFAALLAVHLVSQVLEEAYAIVDVASESGQPWRYLAMLKNISSGKLDYIEEEDNILKEVNEMSTKMNELNIVPDIVVTSTPQKNADELQKTSKDTCLIGQGDEQQNDYDTSTSGFINNLFDMSEVERITPYDDINAQINEYDNLRRNEMAVIVNSAINIALDQYDGKESVSGKCSPISEQSEYSFLSDAGTAPINKAMNDVAFCIDGALIDDGKNIATCSGNVTEVAKESYSETKNEDTKDDIARYENAYLTLNRDDDQCSEDYNDPLLLHPKEILMHDVELTTKQTLDIEPENKNAGQKETLSAISAVSAVSSRKSSLVQRCKTQGSRLMACLRGWWRRKTPGKRKESRVPGSLRGLCPLSPEARRRAASLLDQRRLSSSPTLSQQVTWKFNTVSEALVNSNRWKNYTFDQNPDECG